MCIYIIYSTFLYFMLHRAPVDTSLVTEGVTLFKYQLLLLLLLLLLLIFKSWPRATYFPSRCRKCLSFLIFKSQFSHLLPPLYYFRIHAWRAWFHKLTNHVKEFYAWHWKTDMDIFRVLFLFVFYGVWSVAFELSFAQISYPFVRNIKRFRSFHLSQMVHLANLIIFATDFGPKPLFSSLDFLQPAPPNSVIGFFPP